MGQVNHWRDQGTGEEAVPGPRDRGRGSVSLPFVPKIQEEEGPRAAVSDRVRQAQGVAQWQAESKVPSPPAPGIKKAVVGEVLTGAAE